MRDLVPRGRGAGSRRFEDVSGTLDKGLGRPEGMRLDSTVMVMGLLLVTVGLAGCIGSDGADDPGIDPAACDGCEDDELNTTADPGQDPAVLLVTGSTNASITGAGSGTGMTYVCSPQDCENTHTVDLSPNATGLVIEAAWEASTSMYLAIEVPREHCTQDASGLFLECPDPEPVNGQSPLRLEITDPETLGYTGGWTVRIWVDSPTPQSVQPTLWSTAAYGGPLPSGLTHVQG